MCHDDKIIGWHFFNEAELSHSKKNRQILVSSMKIRTRNERSVDLRKNRHSDLGVTNIRSK